MEPSTATPPLTVVITPTPAALPPGMARFPGYNESLHIQNTVQPDGDSLARGYNSFQKHCAHCHATDLSGEVGHPYLRDLRLRSSYKFGTSDQALYRTIKFGIPRSAMGRNTLRDPEVFDLINFLRSRHKAWSTP